MSYEHISAGIARVSAHERERKTQVIITVGRVIDTTCLLPSAVIVVSQGTTGLSSVFFIDVSSAENIAAALTDPLDRVAYIEGNCVAKMVMHDIYVSAGQILRDDMVSIVTSATTSGNLIMSTPVVMLNFSLNGSGDNSCTIMMTKQEAMSLGRDILHAVSSN